MAFSVSQETYPRGKKYRHTILGKNKDFWEKGKKWFKNCSEVSSRMVGIPREGRRPEGRARMPGRRELGLGAP